MSSPTFPKVPLPPFFDSVKATFADWEKHLSLSSNEFVSVVAFKIVMFAHRETVFGYGYLTSIASGDTVTGEMRVTDEDFTFNPETGWHGGDSFSSPAPKKVAVTARLITANGHDQISLDLGVPQQFQYHAALSTVSGKDPSLSSATVLSGERLGILGGKVLATFSREFYEKTHWPPS